MGTAECAQRVSPFVKTQKREGEVGLFRVVGKYDWFLPNFSYCCPCLGRSGSCPWSDEYTEGLAPPGRQASRQGDCSRVRSNSDIRCAACLQPSWSAWAVCMCPGLTRQTAEANINDLQILPVNPPAAEINKAVEVHFGTKVLQSYKCLQLSWLTILSLARLEFTSVHSSTPFPIQFIPWRNTLLRYFKAGC